ncbi:hypothetical protein E1176_05405 [Fulvivirga sp. RKSG066]|uniref:hypothetical protein n=1 Tax=Fulvivirga aurantia TaxID=2529383 RepID=UPI0012BD150A|nr:hypothetical protein [Fulvivirga aurantia]MTI20453.1 hypothetical protein [Fulvivirga aurantia]
MKVLVFRTNIKGVDVIKIKPLLDAHMSIHKWSIDIADIDNVLRVETQYLNEIDIIDMIRKAGFECETLPDEMSVL